MLFLFYEALSWVLGRPLAGRRGEDEWLLGGGELPGSRPERREVGEPCERRWDCAVTAAPRPSAGLSGSALAAAPTSRHPLGERFAESLEFTFALLGFGTHKSLMSKG